MGYNHSNKTINFTFFSKKRLCNSGLKAKSTTFAYNNMKHSTVRSYAFTEQGVAMLSTVLRSETAIRVSIRIHQKNWWKESIESNQYAIF